MKGEEKDQDERRKSIEVIKANHDQLSGDHSEWEPPDSIPNSEVKTLSADDSVNFRSCESRSLPGFKNKKPSL